MTSSDPDTLIASADRAIAPRIRSTTPGSSSLNDQFDLSVEALEKALSLGYCDFNWLVKDPDLRKLRKHPLYERIQAKIRGLRIKVR